MIHVGIRLNFVSHHEMIEQMFVQVCGKVVTKSPKRGVEESSVDVHNQFTLFTNEDLYKPRIRDIEPKNNPLRRIKQ